MEVPLVVPNEVKTRASPLAFGERKFPELIRIEFPDDEHGALGVMVFAVSLYTDIHPDRAPHLPLVEKGTGEKLPL